MYTLYVIVCVFVCVCDTRMNTYIIIYDARAHTRTHACMHTNTHMHTHTHTHTQTHTQVKSNSRLEWMMEMLHTARRYRAPSRLNVLLLLRDAFMFFVQREHINKIMAEYSVVRTRQTLARPNDWWGSKERYLSFWKDLRFRFHKFQCRDLPQVDLSVELQHIKSAMTKVDTLLLSEKQYQKYCIGPQGQGGGGTGKSCSLKSAKWSSTCHGI